MTSIKSCGVRKSLARGVRWCQRQLKKDTGMRTVGVRKGQELPLTRQDSFQQCNDLKLLEIGQVWSKLERFSDAIERGCVMVAQNRYIRLKV